MSTWHQAHEDDIDYNPDDGDIDICFLRDNNGNHYVSVKADVLRKILKDIDE